MKKSLFSLLLALLLTVGILPMNVWAADFPFVDIPPDAWYLNDVKTAVETGLVKGKTETTYCPDDNLTYAEAVKLAACMHQKNETGTISLVNGNPWYQSYVDYAKMKNIISKDYDWNAAATRAGYMVIFAHALPDASLSKKNEVPDGSVPDVPMSRAESAEIYKLYRAGILQGSPDTYNGKWTEHLCKPDDNIKRSEVSAILTRMMFVDKRLSFSMAPETPAEALKITKQPADTTAKVGISEKAVFTVAASGGKTPYTYQWYTKYTNTDEVLLKNNELNSGTTTDTLTLTSIRAMDDASLYWCVITDAAGAKVISSSAKLSLTQDLKITKQPVSQSGKENTMVSFTVEVEGGKAPYTYKWEATQGGIVFGNITCANVSGEYTKTMTVLLEKSTYPAGENIRCVITDANGKSVISDTVKAILIADDLKITKQPVSQSGKVNTMVTFTVEVEGGKAPYTYRWEATQGDTIFGNITCANVSGEYTKTLTVLLEKSTYPEGENIRCVITDANGKSVVSDYVKATLIPNTSDSLTITTQPKDYWMRGSQDDATFTIQIEHNMPPYTFDWYYGRPGAYVKFDSTFTNTNSDTATFTFSDYDFDDLQASTIDVFCIVTDDWGNQVASKVCYVYKYVPTAPISQPLKITKQPLSYWALDGWEMELEIEVSGGKAPYSYEWQYNEQMNFWETIQMGAKEGKCRVDADGTLHITVSYSDWTGNCYIRCVVTDANGNQVISNSVDFDEG